MTREGWIVVGRNDNSKTIPMYCNVVGLAFFAAFALCRRVARREEWYGDINPTASPIPKPPEQCRGGFMPHSLGGLEMEDGSSACSLDKPTTDCDLCRLRCVPRTATWRLK